MPVWLIGKLFYGEDFIFNPSEIDSSEFGYFINICKNGELDIRIDLADLDLSDAYFVQLFNICKFLMIFIGSFPCRVDCYYIDDIGTEKAIPPEMERRALDLYKSLSSNRRNNLNFGINFSDGGEFNKYLCNFTKKQKTMGFAYNFFLTAMSDAALTVDLRLSLLSASFEALYICQFGNDGTRFEHRLRELFRRYNCHNILAGTEENSERISKKRIGNLRKLRNAMFHVDFEKYRELSESGEILYALYQRLYMAYRKIFLEILEIPSSLYEDSLAICCRKLEDDLKILLASAD